MVSEGRFKCESLQPMIDGCQMPNDGKSSHGLWPGELKIKVRLSHTQVTITDDTMT